MKIKRLYDAYKRQIPVQELEKFRVHGSLIKTYKDAGASIQKIVYKDNLTQYAYLIAWKDLSLMDKEYGTNAARLFNSWEDARSYWNNHILPSKTCDERIPEL